MRKQDRKKPGRKPVGLTHDKPFTFNTNQRGLWLIARRAKALNLSKAAYIRYAIDREAE